MFRHLPKLLAVAAMPLFVTGCMTHDHMVYRSPLPWISHSAEESQLPPPPPSVPSAAEATTITPATPSTQPALPQP